MADAHKNFAYSTVATAPSPATSGTSLVVAAGTGTKFPAVPFNATIWPTGVQPTTANAEIVRVTAISTDTLTITRAQEGTAARTVVIGDQIAATVTALTLTDAESKTAVSLTAEQSLTAGNPLGISNLLDDKVTLANRVLSAVSHGVPNVTGSLQNGNGACAIGGDKFVQLLYSSDTSDTLYAQVVSIDRTTLTQTLGTALAVGTANNAGTTLTRAAVCKLGTDKFIVFYNEDASTTVIKYRVGTVSGTTITFGSAGTASTAASTVATSPWFGADYISTDKGVFAYKAATTTSSKVVVFTVSGTTATFGTEVTPGTNSQISDTGSYIKTIATDKFVLVTTSAANSMYGQVFTCSGTTITAGTEQQISTATINNGLIIQVCNPATDVFVVSYNNTGTIGGLLACTVATRTITAGTAITRASVGNNYALCWAEDASTIYFIGGSTTVIWKATLSGTTLTDKGIVAQALTSFAVTSAVLVRMDNGYSALVQVLTTTQNLWIQGMSNNYIGFAQSTVARAASINVLVRGIDSNQSGLTAGAKYLVDAGTISIVADTVTVNTLDDIDVVTAVSSTEILV